MMTDAERRSCFVHVVTEYKELLLQDGIDYSSFSPHECRLILDRMNQLNTTTAQQFGLKDEAVAEYITAIRLAPKSGRNHYDYAMFLFQDGKLDQAIAEFGAALKYNPNHPEAHYYLGRALYVKGDYEGAKAHYLQTARLDPKAPVHSGLGAAYFRLGQTSEAIAEFKEALRLNPDDSEAAENLRFALRAQGDSRSR